MTDVDARHISRELNELKSIVLGMVLTSTEAARELGISLSSLRMKRDSGEIPFHMEGKHYRYKRSDLYEYLSKK